MEKLKDNVKDSNMLSKALQKNGEAHTNYKAYMPMERALSFLLTGDLYLSNGAKWNDKNDREQMKESFFARSFSYSTSENIAMWMLYGGNRGKNGAMLNFYPKIIKEALNTSVLTIGKFGTDGIFEECPEYKVVRKDNFDIFITDVIYFENLKDDKVNITLADEHVVVKKAIIDHADIFSKKFPWSYEKECRLVVCLSDAIIKDIPKDYDTVRIKISEPLLKKMRNNRLFRSPIYQNGTDYGVPSKLTGEVEWDI